VAGLADDRRLAARRYPNGPEPAPGVRALTGCEVCSAARASADRTAARPLRGERSRMDPIGAPRTGRTAP